MFKNLKKKLEQGVSQSPLRGALASASKFLDDKDPDDKPLAESTPRKSDSLAAGDDGNQSMDSNTSSYDTANQSLNDSQSAENQSVGGVAPSNVPVGQLVDIPLQDTSSESSGTYIPGDVTPQASRSRTSSISSVTSDSSFFTNISYPQHHYTLPSDMESEMEESGTDLHTVSKEDLYHYIQKYQRRATRYKSKFMEVVVVYKDMVQERDKFKHTLTQSQDRAFRRVSELKEQIQLDQTAKRDVEENYNFVIEEKGEFIKVLQTQVKLLKEGKEIPPDLEERIQAGKAKTLEENEKSDQMSTELSSLRDKVKHQDGLLQRCKEIIRSNKEKHAKLAEDNDALHKQYEDVQKDLARLKGTSSPDTVTKLTNQIKQARHVIEQLETDRQLAIAEVKQQIHEEMNKKDTELAEARNLALALTEENGEMKDKIERMEKTAGDHLEKSREIIRKLREEKQQAIVNMEEKLRQAENDMENEKSKLVQEISRGKSAAIALMQEQTVVQVKEEVDTAVMERDELWQKKMSDQEMAHLEILVNKEKELKAKAAQLQDDTQKLISEKEHALNVMLQESNVILKEKERDMQLAMEERDLMKMATLSHQDTLQDQLQSRVDALTKEKSELETLVLQMQEENEKMKNGCDRKLKEGKELSDKQIVQLRIEHEKYVAELLTEHEKSIHEKMENLTDKHAQQVAELIRKHEDSSQSSNAELEKYYTAELKKMKSNMERLLHEKNQQTETLNITIQHLRADISTSEQEFEQRSMEFKVKMSEGNESYKLQIAECDKLQRELDNVREEYENNKLQMEEEVSLFRKNVQTISESRSSVEMENSDLKAQLDGLHQSSSVFETENSELKAQLDRISESHSSVETENSELKTQLDRLSKEVEEKYQSADSKVKELLGQVTDFEAQKMDLAQERQKLLDANNECVKKISIMDKIISEKDSEIEELKKHLSDVTGELNIINNEKKESVIEKEHVIKLNSENQARLKNVETEREGLLQRVATLEAEVQESVSVADELKLSVSATETKYIEEKKSLADQLNSLQADLNTNIEELQQKTTMLAEKEAEIHKLINTCAQHGKTSEELQHKSSTLENQLDLLQTNMEKTDNQLKESKERFNQLRTEAKNRIKELKDKHNAELTEQEQMWTNKVLELEKQINDELESKKALEESFKLQFQEKQNHFRDSCSKIKESFQNKLQKKDEEFETKLSALMQQKDVSAEDITRNLEAHYAQQATNMKEKHADDMRNLTAKWEETLHTHKEKCENEISALVSQCDILRNELDVNRNEFESERARLLAKQEQNETKLRESFNETIDNLQVQLSELHSNHNKSNSLCSQLTIEKESMQKHFDLTVDKHKATIADHDNRTEQINQKMVNLSEKHVIDIQEKELVIANISARVSDLENTNTSMEEMLKAMNSQCQEKDDKISSLLEENDKIMNLKNECDTKLISLEKSFQELQNLCSDQAAEIENIHDEGSKNIKNLREEYENKLMDLSSSDEELQSQLKVLNEKLSDTDKKMHDCIQDYEAQIIEYKNKLDRQGRALSEEKELLASQLFEMTTHAQNKKEELQATLNSTVTESDSDRKRLESAIMEFECKVTNLESGLSEKSNQLSEMDGIMQERENQVTNLQTELKEIQATNNKFDGKICDLENKIKQLHDDHASEIATIETNWQSKANELKQKFLIKLKEIQLQGEEKVNKINETLRQERAGSEERLSALQASLKEETSRKGDVSSELAHANTKLLQLDHSKETIMEKDARIISLENIISEKDAFVTESVEKSKGIEERLCSCEQSLTERNELISELQANMCKIVDEYEARIKGFENELQLAKDALLKSETVNQEEKGSFHQDIDKLKQLLLESKSEFTKLTDTFTKSKNSLEEEAVKMKCVEAELTQKVANNKQECTERTEHIHSLEQQLQVLRENYNDGLLAVQNAQDEIQELTTEKDSLKSAIETLESKTSALSNELETSVSEITGSASVISDLQSSVNSHLEEKSELQKKCNEFEDKISELTTGLQKEQEETHMLVATHKTTIEDIQKAHEQEKEEIKSKFETESAAKVAEFKKKAELYISQIKKQVQGEKETSESKYMTTISDLENSISRLKTEKENITAQFEKEKDDIEQRYRDQINSKDKLEHAQLLKAESSTNFIEQLKLSLEKEKTEKENINIAMQKLSLDKAEIEKKYKTEVNELEVEFQDMKIAKDEEIETLEAKINTESDKLNNHYHMLLQTKDNEHMSKIKELMKEFNQKYSDKVKEYEASLTEMLDKSSREDVASQRETQRLLNEAQAEIRERDDRLDDVRMEYESKLKESDSALQTQAAEFQRQIVDLKQRHEIEMIEIQEHQTRTSVHSDTMHREEVASLTQGWNIERQELLKNNQLAMDAVQSGVGAGDLGHQVLVLTKEIENVKEKHRLELAEVLGQNDLQKTFLPQPLIAAPDGATTDPNHLDNQYMEVQTINLQARVAQLEGQLAQTRLREKELQTMPFSNSYGSPPSPGFYTDGTPSGPLLTEPTQLEYLRNILYLYMMGKETKTLCRVIGTVVHFSEDQMKQLLAKEESQGSWRLS